MVALPSHSPSHAGRCPDCAAARCGRLTARTVARVMGEPQRVSQTGPTACLYRRQMTGPPNVAGPPRLVPRGRTAHRRSLWLRPIVIRLSASRGMETHRRFLSPTAVSPRVASSPAGPGGMRSGTCRLPPAFAYARDCKAWSSGCRLLAMRIGWFSYGGKPAPACAQQGPDYHTCISRPAGLHAPDLEGCVWTATTRPAAQLRD